MKFIRKNFLALLVMTVAVLSIVLVCFLPGVHGKGSQEKYSIHTLGLVFGNATMHVSSKTYSASVALTGGMSVFGLASAVTLITGVILAIISIKVRNKSLDYYGIVLVIISGICMLMLFEMGTMIKVNNIPYEYKGFVLIYGFELGAGAIVYGITTIVGGIVGIIIEENNLIR